MSDSEPHHWIQLRQASDRPLHWQIVDRVTQRILRGDLRPGDPLPTAPRLAKGLLVSVMTTRRAYRELAGRGYLELPPGESPVVAFGVRPRARLEAMTRVAEDLRAAIDEALARGFEPDQVRALVESHLVPPDFEEESR